MHFSEPYSCIKYKFVKFFQLLHWVISQRFYDGYHLANEIPWKHYQLGSTSCFWRTLLVCKPHTSHEIKVMSFNILFHEWNISKGMYSLLQYRKDWTSRIPFPLSSTNYFRKKNLAYKDIIKNSFYIIQNGMKHSINVFFERHW